MKTESGSQLKFEFTRVPSLRELGELMGPRTIRLSGKFLLEKLNPATFFLDYENPGEPPTIFLCTFCEQGRMQLKRVEPKFDILGKKKHIGNTCEYRCTECDAKFVGEYFFKLTG